METVAESTSDRAALIMRRWKRMDQHIALILLRKLDSASQSVATTSELELETGFRSGAVRRTLRRLVESGVLRRKGSHTSSVFEWDFSALASQASAVNDAQETAYFRTTAANQRNGGQADRFVFFKHTQSGPLSGEDQETLGAVMAAAHRVYAELYKRSFFPFKSGRFAGGFNDEGTCRSVLKTVRALASQWGVGWEVVSEHIIATYLRDEQRNRTEAWSDKFCPLDWIDKRGALTRGAATFRPREKKRVVVPFVAPSSPSSVDVAASAGELVRKLAGGAR